MREGSREAVAGHPSGAEARLFVESFGTAEAVPFHNICKKNLLAAVADVHYVAVLDYVVLAFES